MTSLRIGLAGTLAALLLSIAAAGSAAIKPEEVVRRAESADRLVSYRGIKQTNLYLSGRIIQAKYKIVHLKPDRTRIEYFGPPELAGIIAITKGSENWRFLPKKGQWERQKWELDADRVELAAKNYRIASGGSGNVAGRSAYVYKFSPKKRGSPTQAIWVDKQHFLILRSKTWNAKGDLKTASAFTQISFSPEDISAAVFEVDGGLAAANSAGKPDLQVVKPSYIPKGYELVDINSINVGGELAAHLKYTNGLNTISIFERKGSGQPKEMENLFKVLPRGVRLNSFVRDGVTFTIIGDIDKKELDKIVRSIRP